jgi:hypothetical protein
LEEKQLWQVRDSPISFFAVTERNPIGYAP